MQRAYDRQVRKEMKQDSVRTNVTLTLNLLTTTIVAPPSNASKWQMGFNSAFKGLRRIRATSLAVEKQ